MDRGKKIGACYRLSSEWKKTHQGAPGWSRGGVADPEPLARWGTCSEKKKKKNTFQTTSDDLVRVQTQRRSLSPWLAGRSGQFSPFSSDGRAHCHTVAPEGRLGWMGREWVPLLIFQSSLLLVTHKLESWGIITNPASFWANELGRKPVMLIKSPLKWLFNSNIGLTMQTENRTWWWHEKGENSKLPTTDGPWQRFDSEKNKDFF